MTSPKSYVIIIAAVAIAGSLLYFYFDPSGSRLFPPCPFYRLTGFFCPGCGSQRAFHALLHGDLPAAAGHNVLFLLFLPVVSYAAVVRINNIFRTKKITQPLFRSTIFAISVLVLVLVFWVARNIPAAPFDELSQ